MLSKRLKGLSPYVPGEQPQDKKYLKLNTNENPFPPCPEIVDFLKNFDYERLRLYPDPLAMKLREALAKTYGVKKENVFAGNGSDEVLSFCFYAFFDSDKGPLLFPEFTYSFYPVYCDYYGIGYRKIPLNPDFSIGLDPYARFGKNCGIIFPNPNAPTGICLPFSSIKNLVEKYSRDNVIIIDEAYIDFGGESALPLISEHENVLIVRTYSKSFCLAGLRIGFAIGSGPLIDALFTVKDSFNSYPLDTLSQNIGTIAASNHAYYEKINRIVSRTRDDVSALLAGCGWKVLPSTANFIFASKPGVPGKEIYLRLKDQGILVRYFDKEGIRDYIRITIGTNEDMERFLDVVKKIF
jgi:histidinol-phosphate aminotransferase